MKIVAFVPIKMNNERVPGKNTKLFDDGTPLMHLILKTLKNIQEIDEVYVYCSRQEIKEFVIDGIEYMKIDECYDSDSIEIEE